MITDGASALHNQLRVPTWVWWPVVAVAVAAAWVLVVRGVRISTRVTLALGVIEVLVLVALSAALIASAGDRNTLSVFAPHTGNAHGVGSVFGGMVYALLAFVGFETTASLSEEASEPRKTVPLAMVTSVVFVGLLFLLASYAVMVYWGPNEVAIGHHLFADFNAGDPIDGLAKKVWGWGWVVVLLACVNSIFNAGVGSTNAQARMGYAVARVGLLPRHMGQVHQRHKTPMRAASVGVCCSLALCLALGFAMGGVDQALGFVGALATLLFVIAYGSVTISCTAYYWRVRRNEFRVIRHGVVPVVGLLFLIPVLLAALGINFLNLGIAPLEGDARWTPELVGLWLLAGAVTYGVLRVRRSPALEEMGLVFSEDLHGSGAILDSEPAEVGSAA